MNKAPQKVRFRGAEYWLQADADGDFGPLAPLGHCDENGNLLPGAEFFDSFAHLYPNGTIMRYHRQIGTREDLEKIL